MNPYATAALKLHAYVFEHHWNGQTIVGPDPIGRINWRITRFVKSYIPWLPWKDRLAYLQGQSYWIKANLRLFELTQQPRYLEIAERCADYVTRVQLASGAWEHPPIRERRGFISTVETVWACLGLVAAFQRLSKVEYRTAILKGYDGLIHVIGFRPLKDGLSINYHAHTRELVPNASTMLLWLLAEISEIAGDERYLAHTTELLRFIQYSQMQNGEIEYIYKLRPHFQCYQYNSFEFMDLAHYYQLTRDERIHSTLKGMAGYLSTGVTQLGSCRYNCFKETPEVNYWTGALAAALRKAHELGLGEYLALSEQASEHLLAQQRHDGGFDFSRGTYGFLRDRCSYPRYLAMILYHLLCFAQVPSRDDESPSL